MRASVNNYLFRSPRICPTPSVTMAGVMGNIFDLETPIIVAGYTRRIPGPVRRLSACPCPTGSLMLRWKPPAGGAFITGYRIERTCEGREYELLGETKRLVFFVNNVRSDEPWFYRVTAFNMRGAGGFGLVWLFRRSNEGKNMLMPVAAVPGLRVNICE